MYKLNKQKKKSSFFPYTYSISEETLLRRQWDSSEMNHTIKPHPVHRNSHSIHPSECVYNNTDSLCWSGHLFQPRKLFLLLPEGEVHGTHSSGAPGWDYLTILHSYAWVDKFRIIFLNMNKTTFPLI